MMAVMKVVNWDKHLVAMMAERMVAEMAERMVA